MYGVLKSRRLWNVEQIIYDSTTETQSLRSLRREYKNLYYIK